MVHSTLAPLQIVLQCSLKPEMHMLRGRGGLLLRRQLLVALAGLGKVSVPRQTSSHAVNQQVFMEQQLSEKH